MPESEMVSYQFTFSAAKEQQIEKAIRELTEIGEPQNGVYTSGITDIRTQRKWLNYFVGAIYGSKSI